MHTASHTGTRMHACTHARTHTQLPSVKLALFLSIMVRSPATQLDQEIPCSQSVEQEAKAHTGAIDEYSLLSRACHKRQVLLQLLCQQRRTSPVKHSKRPFSKACWSPFTFN